MPGPVSTTYLEKESSTDESLSSNRTRPVPEGQPEPSNDVPTTLTYGGTAVMLAHGAESAAASATARAENESKERIIVILR